MEYPSLNELFLDAIDNRPNPKAQMYRTTDGWKCISSREMLRRVAGLSKALAELGIKTGDRVRIDLKKGTANILISDEELNERRATLAQNGGFPYPKSQTPWQQIQREMVAQFDEGMVLKPAVQYQRLAQTMGVPRDNH